MPLRVFKCPRCGILRETLKKEVQQCHHVEDDETFFVKMEEQLTSPSTKLLETIDPYTGKTRLKDQMKILKERARNHSRDIELHDLVQMNRDNKLTGTQFLRKDGTTRKKVDDK